MLPSAARSAAAAAPLPALLLLAMLAMARAQPHPACAASPGAPLALTRLDSLKAGNWTGTASMEVLDYDAGSKLAAVIEARRSDTTPLALLVVNYADPAHPTIHRRIPVGVSNFSSPAQAAADAAVGTPNSVATWAGYAAVAADGVPATAPGIVRIYHMASGSKLAELSLPGCAMPDSLRWTADGRRMVVACEGEPVTQEIAGSDPRVEPNPEGAIAIVYVAASATFTPPGASWSVANFSLTYRLLSIQAYIDSLTPAQYASLLAGGMRVDPRLNKTNAGKDLEPEYVALDSRATRGWVTLQEANAVLALNLRRHGRERIAGIWPLGWKDWSKSRLDPSDRDGTRLRTCPGVYSWYQPDTIVHAQIGGREYLFLANEGDTKAEATRVKDLAGGLDPAAFGNVTAARQDAELGRLSVDPLFGIKGGYNASRAWNQQGPYEKLIAYGGRSFSILSAEDGSLVYESGGSFEEFFASDPRASKCFNCNRDANAPDSRSDDSGPEPEALEVFALAGRTYAAVGLERMGGFLLYEVSVPAAPLLLGYFVNRNFDPALGSNLDAIGDLAPEGIKFVRAADTVAGAAALLLHTNEVSATLSTWALVPCLSSLS